LPAPTIVPRVAAPQVRLAALAAGTTLGAGSSASACRSRGSARACRAGKHRACRPRRSQSQRCGTRPCSTSHDLCAYRLLLARLEISGRFSTDPLASFGIRAKSADLLWRLASITPRHLDEPSRSVLEFTRHKLRVWGQRGHASDYAPFVASNKPESAAAFKVVSRIGFHQLARMDTDGACWFVHGEPKCPKGGWSFRVALRTQPVYAAASADPIIDISFAYEPFDVPNVGAWVVGLDLPVTLCDPLHFEDHAWSFDFGHGRGMHASGPSDKPKSAAKIELAH
jgi:hypothetical protein